MAISPPSDIVLDVAKAADPLQYRAAVEKLARLSDVEASAADELRRAPRLVRVRIGRGRRTSPIRCAPTCAAVSRRSNPARRREQAKEPYRQFEAFVLQTFIQQMLPKDASHVFGEGLAGSFWSSMLAEQIAGQMAKAGGIGIADLMASREGASATSSALPGYMTSLELASPIRSCPRAMRATTACSRRTKASGWPRTTIRTIVVPAESQLALPQPRAIRAAVEACLRAIERIEQVVDQETLALRQNQTVDLDDFSRRKSHGLLDLTRGLRGLDAATAKRPIEPAPSPASREARREQRGAAPASRRGAGSLRDPGARDPRG